MNRRAFIKSTVAAGAAWSAVPLVGRKTARRYRTALVGSGWWGMNILREAIRAGESQVVALCDVDRGQLAPAAEEVERLTGEAPRRYGDYRELLAAERPELVVVATPDHWHPLITIAACEAGADVYVEKPVGHTVDEGRAMVEAARRHERVVQVGTHRRVSPHNWSGIAFLRSGKAGRIGMVRAFVHYGGGPGEAVPDADPPPGLDWDFWCGPAPLRPFNRRIHPRGFRQYLDFANGQIGDWGIHWLDQILWWTDEPHPRRIASTGGLHVRRDGADAPDTQVATFEFESFTATWEHRLYAANQAERHAIGAYFYGTEGTFHMGWLDGWTFYPADERQPTLHEPPQLHEPDHQNIRELWADFLEAVRTRRRPVCDIETGHRATAMSLLAMAALKTGRTLEWDGRRIAGDAEANALLRRPYRAPWTYPAPEGG